MYLWTAADVSCALEGAHRAALEINRGIGLPEVAFTLPAHVSLHISFSVPDAAWDEACRLAEGILSAQSPFSIRVRGLEQAGSILWIAMEENAALRGLHEKFLALKAHLGVPPHPFDLDFYYHATLFLSDDGEKMARMEQALRPLPLPEEIQIRSFLMGKSESGKAGEYRVFKSIPAAKEEK